jgi:hypothetical protein
MVTEIGLFESRDLTLLHFCLWGGAGGGGGKSEVWKIKMATRDELFARNFNAAARIKKREDQLRLTTRDLRTRVAKRANAGSGIFERLL